jgi:hypothetical protein
MSIKMKIYEFRHNAGATDWVIAPNISEARDFFLRIAGCGDFEDMTVKSVAKSKWPTMYILDFHAREWDEDYPNNKEDDYCNGYKIEETFADYAARNQGPGCDMIATTEF